MSARSAQAVEKEREMQHEIALSCARLPSSVQMSGSRDCDDGCSGDVSLPAAFFDSHRSHVCAAEREREREQGVSICTRTDTRRLNEGRGEILQPQQQRQVDVEAGRRQEEMESATVTGSGKRGKSDHKALLLISCLPPLPRSSALFRSVMADRQAGRPDSG